MYSTAESVSRAHPDKVADQIADAILDGFLEKDPLSRVACEVLITQDLVVLAGEIASTASIDLDALVRKTLLDIGYNKDYGIDPETCSIQNVLRTQSEDLQNAVTNSKGNIFAGDQGIVYGYAVDETPHLMPLPIFLANNILERLEELTYEKSFLLKDAKSQVTVSYIDGMPREITDIVLSTQHTEDVSQKVLEKELSSFLYNILPQEFLKPTTKFYINPSGRFVIGGAAGDTGLTGRKPMVDTYGSIARYGGGSLSGKDATKIDRSGAYMARYIAKNIVASHIARKCEVALVYCIGRSHPLSLTIETFNTSAHPEALFLQLIPEVFDLSLQGIIEALDLYAPRYLETAVFGHFGKSHLPWEKTDKVALLQEKFQKYT